MTINNYNLPYPDNLIADMWLYSDVPVNNLPQTVGSSLEEVLDQLQAQPDLERVIKMVRMKYAEHKSFAEIAATYSISDTRASGIVYKTVRLLRTPALLNYIEKFAEFDHSRPLANFPILLLGVPIQAVHALRYEKMNIVDDILKLSRRKLLEHRGIGTGIHAELVSKLRKAGYDTSRLSK